MSSKKPSLPSVPEYYSFPGQDQSILDYRTLGNRLTSFDLTGSLSPLQQTIDLDPEISKLAMQSAQAQLAPQFRDIMNQVKQQAANTGALNSSTFGNALAQTGEDLQSQLQSITYSAALQDRERALQNRLGLFGTGLSVTESAIGMGSNQQGSRNQFNQQAFENQLALSQLNTSNRGGLSGALTGSIGGVLAGLSAPLTGGASVLLAGLGGLGGGLAGGFGSAGTGGELLSAGSSLYGKFGGTGVASGKVKTGTTPSKSLYEKLYPSSSTNRMLSFF